MAPRHVTDFVRQLTPMATEIGARYGIDPALIITQAAIESGWGQSVAGNNYFGVKSHGQPGGQTVLTKEEVNGQLVPRYEQFRSYGDLRGSMEDYARFLQENPRYEGVFQAQNLAGQIDAIAKSGYATDSTYPALLEDVSRMVQSNMLPVPPGEIPNVVGTARDVVPPPAPMPVTPSPNVTAMRSQPTMASVPLPRPRPSSPDIVAQTMAALNNRPLSMGAADSLAMNPVTGQAVPDLNAGRYTGPQMDAGYYRDAPGFNAGSGAVSPRLPSPLYADPGRMAGQEGAPMAPRQPAPLPAMQSTDMRLMRQPFVTPPSNPTDTETARLAALYAGGGPTRPNMNAAERLLPQGNLAPRVPMAMPSAPPIMINPVRVASNAPMPMPLGMRPLSQRSALAPVPMPANMRPMMPSRQATAPQQAPLRVVVNGGNVQRQAPTREQQIAAILAQSRGTPSFGGGGSIDGAVQPTGTIFKRA